MDLVPYCKPTVSDRKAEEKEKENEKTKEKKKETLCTRTFNQLSVFERKGGTHLSVKERKMKKGDPLYTDI